MGNCNNESCPSHPGNSITRICLCESCLEPLCDECVIPHNNVHAKLGYPSQIQPYDTVKGEYKGRDKVPMRKREQRIADNLAPTSLQIKDMTREFF